MTVETLQKMAPFVAFAYLTLKPTSPLFSYALGLPIVDVLANDILGLPFSVGFGVTSAYASWFLFKIYQNFSREEKQIDLRGRVRVQANQVAPPRPRIPQIARKSFDQANNRPQDDLKKIDAASAA